jgi:hypothetical protein
MRPRNAYKDMLDNVVSHITCVSMNHQNQLEQMANGAMFATFSSSYRPVGKPVSHHVVTRPTFSSLLFLDHHTGHPSRHDAQILLYECIFDAF